MLTLHVLDLSSIRHGPSCYTRSGSLDALHKLRSLFGASYFRLARALVERLLSGLSNIHIMQVQRTMRKKAREARERLRQRQQVRVYLISILVSTSGGTDDFQPVHTA